MTQLNILIFGEAHNLLHLYLICLLIHLTLLAIDSPIKKQFLKNELPSFIRDEFINICLICTCAVMDKILPFLKINWDWSIALLFILLVIVEEMGWIIAQSSHYVNVGFLKDTITQISSLIHQKSKK